MNQANDAYCAFNHDGSGEIRHQLASGRFLAFTPEWDARRGNTAG
jgi:hypothetical protein